MLLHSQALGIEHTLVGASEPNPAFRAFTLANQKPAHFHASFGEQNRNCPCLLHAGSNGCWKPQHIDLAVMGTPCDPFSEQRCKRYQDGTVKQHHLYKVTFEDALNLLTSKDSPNAVILEQVLGFAEPESQSESTSPLDRPVHFNFGVSQSLCLFLCCGPNWNCFSNIISCCLIFSHCYHV